MSKSSVKLTLLICFYPAYSVFALLELYSRILETGHKQGEVKKMVLESWMNTYYLLLSFFRRIELKLAALTFLVHITDTSFSYCNSALICYTVDFLRTDFSLVEWSLQLSHHVCYCVHVFRMPAYLVIPSTLHFINDSIYICYPYLMTISVRVCVCVHIANIFFLSFYSTTCVNLHHSYRTSGEVNKTHGLCILLWKKGYCIFSVSRTAVAFT